MKKRLLLMFFVLTLSIPVLAMEKIPYRNLDDGDTIVYDLEKQVWTSRFDKKRSDYFVKKGLVGKAGFSEYYSPQGQFLFSTGCQYEFIYKGRLIGYSNVDLKFYEFLFENDIFKQRVLDVEEIKSLFKDFEIINISDFSTTTNSLKVKKKRSDLKIILHNDLDKEFFNYEFVTNNSKLEKYPLKGFLNIKRKGMIHFSRTKNKRENDAWYIILVR